MTALRSSAVPLVVCYVIFLSLSFGLVILRFVSIRILRRQIKAHDYLCIVSLVFLVAYAIVTLIGTVAGGIGLHMNQVSPSQLTTALKTFFASQFFWVTSISAFRLSILHLYIEIFSIPLFRSYAYGSACVVGLFYIGSITTSLTLCRPINYQWNKTISGSCGNLGTAELAAAAFNMALDVVIVLLPLPVVWKLQMPKQKKVGVTVAFALGLSIAGINLCRIIKVLDCDLKDFTYCTRDSAILTVAEMAVGIIVACIPTLGPVIFPRRFGPSAQKRYKGNYSDTVDGTAHARLHGYHNGSLGEQSFQGSVRNDLELENPLEYGDSKSYIYARADASEAPNPITAASDSIGVRRDIEITTASHLS